MPEPLLRLSDIRKSFGTQSPVKAVDGVTFDIAEGEFVAITGKSGSGKSTLLNLIGLLDSPTAGTYLVAGQDTSTMNASRLDGLRAEVFGIVFQSFHLVPYLTTAENVELGLTYFAPGRATRRREVADMLDLVDLSSRADASVATLSGGERQRTAIARALIRGPRILLADEPTGNLDETNSSAIIDLFRAINRVNTTVILVTHDGDTAATCPRQIHIRDGQIDSDLVVDRAE